MLFKACTSRHVKARQKAPISHVTFSRLDINHRFHLLPQFIQIVAMGCFYTVISLFPPFLLCFLSSTTATCYYPNGTAVINTNYQPCSNGTVSMCCALDRDNSNSCLSNGLCHDPCTVNHDCNHGSPGQFWRESCTDPSWTSPFCLRLCDDESVCSKLDPF